MRIGINGSSLIAVGAPLAQIVDHAAEAEAAGFSSYWLAQLAVPDALTVIADDGRPDVAPSRSAPRSIPTWPRHPLMLAAQALTVQEAIGNRLALGIGLAHKSSVESTLKIPVRHAGQAHGRVPVGAAAGDDRPQGDLHRRHLVGRGRERRRDARSRPPTVMLAAMGPRMLRLAGARTAGSILWLSGPKAIAEQIKPALDAAAAEAGRPAPRIVASVPVCVTSKPDDVRG